MEEPPEYVRHDWSMARVSYVTFEQRRRQALFWCRYFVSDFFCRRRYSFLRKQSFRNPSYFWQFKLYAKLIRTPVQSRWYWLEHRCAGKSSDEWTHCRSRGADVSVVSCPLRQRGRRTGISVLLLLLLMMMFVPRPVALQGVENILAVRVDELRPRLPQRLNDVVDEPNLQQN